MLDAYGRQDTLSHVLNYENDFFLETLEKRHFIVPRSNFSNYPQTLFSLSSLFQMDFLPSNKEKKVIFNDLYQYTKGHNLVNKILKNNNYFIATIPMADTGLSNDAMAEINLRKNRNAEIRLQMLNLTPFRKYFYSKHYYSSLSSVKKAMRKIKQPKFIFLHYMGVHDCIYEENGSIASIEKLREHSNRLGCMLLSNGKGNDNPFYAYTVHYTNKAILSCIDSIQEEDPNAIIILTADHGPSIINAKQFPSIEAYLRNPDSSKIESYEDLRNRFGIFQAIYIPPSTFDRSVCNLLQGTSLVNLFRILFSYLSDTSIPLLPNKQFWLFAGSNEISEAVPIDVTHFRMESEKQ